MLDEEFQLPSDRTVCKYAYTMAEKIREEKFPKMVEGIKKVGAIAIDYGYRFLITFFNFKIRIKMK